MTSEEKRAETLIVYGEQGLAAAARHAGVTKTTCRRWARSAGLDPAELSRGVGEQTAAATAARQLHRELVREELRDVLLERAMQLLERIDEPHIDFKGKDIVQVEYPNAPAGSVRSYVWSAAVLLDKYRLEMGEATERIESNLEEINRHAKAVMDEFTARRNRTA